MAFISSFSHVTKTQVTLWFQLSFPIKSYVFHVLCESFPRAISMTSERKSLHQILSEFSQVLQASNVRLCSDKSLIVCTWMHAWIPFSNSTCVSHLLFLIANMGFSSHYSRSEFFAGNSHPVFSIVDSARQEVIVSGNKMVAKQTPPKYELGRMQFFLFWVTISPTSIPHCSLFMAHISRSSILQPSSFINVQIESILVARVHRFQCHAIIKLELVP